VSHICDRSPCDQLLRALGRWILYSQSEGVFYMRTAPSDENFPEWPIDEIFDYCPFCGTRISEVGPIMLERFTKPRKRRRVIRLQG
jgi:hypothetical protein